MLIRGNSFQQLKTQRFCCYNTLWDGPNVAICGDVALITFDIPVLFLDPSGYPGSRVTLKDRTPDREVTAARLGVHETDRHARLKNNCIAHKTYKHS